jgi:hypothetical protein
MGQRVLVRDKCGMRRLYRPRGMVTADGGVTLLARAAVTAKPECRA